VDVSSPPLFNGWGIAFHPLFAGQRSSLLARTRELRKEMSDEEWKQHSDVKLMQAVMVGIREKITLDPYASHFALSGPLKKYCRLKKMGLPERYRLFFKPVEFDELKVVIILWLGFPRREGDSNDCYEVFKKLLVQGAIPENVDELLRISQFYGVGT
jgi:toxin YhaV